MNAVTRKGGEGHFLDVQNIVMEDGIRKEGVPDERTYAFIIDNAPLFRFFATRLPDELGVPWDNADTNSEARGTIEIQYEMLRTGIKRIFEQQFDADTQSALTEAAESGNIALAERILEAHALLIGRTEE